MYQKSCTESINLYSKLDDWTIQYYFLILFFNTVDILRVFVKHKSVQVNHFYFPWAFFIHFFSYVAEDEALVGSTNWMLA